ncbi:MAG: metallophosphatase [Bacteroidetes bacterium]|nr:MAG: metallophosphatase [Bacteroidota bacterium]
MRRRTFIRQIGATTVLVGSGLQQALALGMDSTTTTLSILHTNDWHSRIDPFPEDGSRNAGSGGALRRALLLERLRQELEHVLLLDSGDIFQGTPYFNFYGGEIELKLMSAMGYDAATLGNHDFDGGIESLATQTQLHANFPFINCNYEFANTPLEGRVLPYQVFIRGPLRIGVLGVGIELAGLVGQKLTGETQYLDPVANANKTALLLKEEEKCDLVICLSHLGYQYREEKISDVIFAAQSKNIDVILGGHTHTFLDHPVVIHNRNDQPVLINQVGWAGILLGRIDIAFSRQKGKRCITCNNEWIS